MGSYTPREVTKFKHESLHDLLAALRGLSFLMWGGKKADATTTNDKDILRQFLVFFMTGSFSTEKFLGTQENGGEPPLVMVTLCARFRKTFSHHHVSVFGTHAVNALQHTSLISKLHSAH